MEPVVNVTFEEALTAVKSGELISREFWGDYQFIFVRPEDSIPVSVVLSNVKSIPNAVKEKIRAFDEAYTSPDDRGYEPVVFHKYLCMWECDNSIVNGWLPTQEDIFANDWYIVTR